MFDRFSEPAIKSIVLAQEEARRLNHNFVGTEALLLGLIGEGANGAARAIKSMGLNLEDARIEVEKIIGRGTGNISDEIPFTPRAKRAIEMALTESEKLEHNFIGPEHLLLGLIREALDRQDDQPKISVAARVLAARGIVLEVLQKKVLDAAPVQKEASLYRKDTYTNHSDDTIKTIMLAQEEARRSGHTLAGSEQILLGLMGESRNVAAKVLKSKGLTLKATRIEVEKIIGRSFSFVAVEVRFTSEAQKVLTLSTDEANRLGHKYVGGGHLLLGILAAGSGVAVEALENFGLDLNELRATVLEALKEQQ